MKNKFLNWLPSIYFGAILLYYFPDFIWGSLGVIRPGDVHDGKIDADYAVSMIEKFSTQALSLYYLIFIGLIIIIFVKIKLKKDKHV